MLDQHAAAKSVHGKIIRASDSSTVDNSSGDLGDDAEREAQARFVEEAAEFEAREAAAMSGTCDLDEEETSETKIGRTDARDARDGKETKVIDGSWLLEVWVEVEA